MIPWFNIQFPSIPFPIIGKLTIHAFGILVATGILVGLHLTKKRGRELGLVDERVDSMVTWALVFGFICAHLFDVLAYQTYGGAHPRLIDIINPISGFSSFGGFTGALIGLFIWCRRNREPIMPYADSLGLRAGDRLDVRTARLLHRARSSRPPHLVLPRRALPRRAAPRSRARRGAVGGLHRALVRLAAPPAQAAARHLRVRS